MQQTFYAAISILVVLASSASAELSVRKDVNPFDGKTAYTIGLESERKSAVLVVSCEEGKKATTYLGLMNTFFFINDPHPSDGEIVEFDMIMDGGAVMSRSFEIIRDGMGIVPLAAEAFIDAILQADQMSIRRGEWYDTFDLAAKPSEFEDAKMACLGGR